MQQTVLCDILLLSHVLCNMYAAEVLWIGVKHRETSNGKIQEYLTHLSVTLKDWMFVLPPLKQPNLYVYANFNVNFLIICDSFNLMPYVKWLKWFEWLLNYARSYSEFASRKAKHANSMCNYSFVYLNYNNSK